MRKLHLLFLAILLSGCSTLNNLVTRPYDPVEYNYSIRISTNSIHAVHRCSDVSGVEFNKFLQDINLDTLTLVEYVGNKDDSFQVLSSTKDLRVLLNEFTSKQKYSLTYCQHKLSNIQEAARTIARSISYSDRFDICAGDVKSRYQLFANSYSTGAISKDEFNELTNDLLKMQDVNKDGCTLENRKKLESTINAIRTAASILTAI